MCLNQSILNAFKGLTVLITGITNPLGFTCAERLLKKGCNVTGIDSDSLNDTKLLNNPKFHFAQCSLSSETDIQKALDETLHKFDNKINVLINCYLKGMHSHVFQMNHRVPQELPLFEELVSQNIIGTFNIIRLTSAIMAKQKETPNVIITSANTLAFDGLKGHVGLAACHHAIVSMTLPLARDLASSNIRAACICSGIFENEYMHRSNHMGKLFGNFNRFPHRYGKFEEFSFAVETVMANPMLNGVTIRVDAAGRLNFHF